jgi:hypothetical protein
MHFRLVSILGLASSLSLLAHHILRRRSRRQIPVVYLSDIPEVHRCLSATGRDDSFAVFCVPDHDRARDGRNVQFSIEKGVVGLDWVLISPGNVRTRRAFSKLAVARNFDVHEVERNGVAYLRVESGDIVSLCANIISEIFAVDEEEPLQLIVSDFQWTPPLG